MKILGAMYDCETMLTSFTPLLDGEDWCLPGFCLSFGPRLGSAAVLSYRYAPGSDSIRGL